jgi:hypothetical protein
MTYKPTSIPSLPASVDPAMRQFLSAIKESLEVKLSQRGNPLDAAATFRDLLDTGLLKIKDGLTTIGGKQYTGAQLVSMVQTTVPAWITSDTAPPAPTGLSVVADKATIVLKWDASAFDAYAYTEVWRARQNNLSNAIKVGSTSGTEYVEALPDEGVYYYWIRDVSRSFINGAFNDINGAATSDQPGTVTVSHRFVGANVEMTWPTPTSNLSVTLYRLEYFSGGVWVEQALLSGNATLQKVSWSGARDFRLTAIDINGNAGEHSLFTVSSQAPQAPQISYTFDGEQVVISWAEPSSDLPITHYEIHDNTTNNLVATQFATTFRLKALWAQRSLYVRAVNSSGAAGQFGVAAVSVQGATVYASTPGDNSINTTVIDNNVLFRWKYVQGSLPVVAFELRRGASWASATIIGKKDGGFTTVFEAPQSQTTYTYWLAAIDSAGLYGTPVSASATVNQPPDYVLAAHHVSDFGATKSNAIVELGVLVLPISTTQTFAQHFTSRGWAGPSAQVSTGYPMFIQPGVTNGYYEEVFDYGATLAAMKITLSYLLTTVAGALSGVTVQITAALDAAFTQNVQTFTASQAYAVNFRYVKFRVSVAATDDKGIFTLENLTLTLDVKLKTQSGVMTASASDHATGGTLVYLTSDKTSAGEKTFIDVDSISVSPNSSVARVAIYNFVDTYEPLSFKVLLFDTSGNPASGSVSYTVRGY